MNITVTIIGLALLGLFLLPALIISKSVKSKGTRLLKYLMSEATKNELIISDSDGWNELAIGIDEKNDKIIYIDGSSYEKVISIFSLKDVRSFRTIPDLTNKKGQNINYNKENKLGLSFIFKDSLKAEINIPFYIVGFGKLTDNEKHLFEKWSEVICKKIG